MLLTAFINMMSRKQKMKTFVKYNRLIFKDNSFFSINIILKKKNSQRDIKQTSV